MSGDRWRLGHRPALDGLRGVAVLLVIAAHARLPGFSGGGIVGVSMFFTLSGFLITSLLLEERHRRGTISWPAFYRRRAVRLLPALVVLVVAAVLVGGARWADVWPVALYVGNWVRAAGGDLGLLSHTWSLAIEEQFYLLWPLVLATAGGRRRWLAGVALAGAAGAVVLRVVWWDGGAGLNRVYFGSETRADAVLVGCALAVWMHGRVERAGSARVATGLVAATGCWSLVGDGAAAYVLAPAAVAVLTGGALLAASQRAVVGWLAHPVLRYAGRRSYALYLWHVPLLWGAPALGLQPVVLVPVAFLVAELSWRCVETPAQRLRGVRPGAGRRSAPADRPTA